MSEHDYNMGLIGAGNMGTGLIRGALDAEIVSGQQVAFYDPDPGRQKAVATLLGHAAADSNQKVVESAQVVVVAVKPQIIASVLSPLQEQFSSDQLVISIAAGVPLARLAELCGPDVALVRVMPNILCTLGEGAAAYSTDTKVSAEQRAFVEALFGAVGTVAYVDEELLDAVTGLSGSGPAFVALFVEALILEGRHPADLKQAVTSPGGTTAAGLRVLERCGLRSAAIEAVVAAARRSEQLGQ